MARLGPQPSVDPELIRKLAAEGRTAREVAEAVGSKVFTVRGIARRYGVTFEPSPEAHSAACSAAQRKRRAAERAARSRARTDRTTVVQACPRAPAQGVTEQGDVDELVATGGRYVDLCLYADKHGLTLTKAMKRWHALGLPARPRVAA